MKTPSVHFNVATIKEAARGRWPQIIPALGGIDPAILDGRHGLCPRCLGSDRFRAFDDFSETGGVFCNQCHNVENGDGFSTLQWLCGWDFAGTLRKVAEYLGLQPSTNGDARAKPNGKAGDLRDKVEWSGAGDTYIDALGPAWCASKPPIKLEALKAAGAKFCKWPKGPSAHRCLALAGRRIDGDTATLAAILLYNLDAPGFLAFGTLAARKTHLVKGSTESWIWAGNVETLQSAKVVVKVEGPSDLLAVLSVGLPDGWVAITNSCGAKSANRKKLDFTWAAGKRIIVIGDADEPGQDGAQRFVAAFHQAGAAEVRMAQLPYKITPDHGKDLRDWLNEPRTAADFAALADAAPVVTAEQAAEWAPKKKAAKKTVTAAVGGQNLTDLGNAERLVAQHGQDLRYCWPWGKWLAWNGRCWIEDQTGAVFAMAKQTVRRMFIEAADIEDQNEREALVKHAFRSEQAGRINAMVDKARSETGIPILPADMDRDPWLFGCHNGVIDLRTGKLLPHDRGRLVTKLSPVNYNPDAEYVLWSQSMSRWFAGNIPLIDFLQRLAGYWLTGDVCEQILAIFWGVGQNGKNTYLTPITDILGTDHAMWASSELVTIKKQQGHPTEKMDLFGKRLVVASEPEAGCRLAESWVKQLTGGDMIRGRRCYEDPWEFRPTHKVVFVTNHKPQIHGTDVAIWRRIRLVPFSVVIPDAERDRQLPAKIKAEYEGILAWMVYGCLEWQRQGLGEPEAVVEATRKYRSEEDRIGGFLAECCIVDPTVTMKSKTLYGCYKDYVENAREFVLSQTAFGTAMTERGFERYTSNGVWYRGVALLTE